MALQKQRLDSKQPKEQPRRRVCCLSCAFMTVCKGMRRLPVPGTEPGRDTAKPRRAVTWPWRSATTMAGEEVSTGLPGGSCCPGAWGLQPRCCAGSAGGASGCASVNVTDRFCSAEGTQHGKRRVTIWEQIHGKRDNPWGVYS